VGRIEWIEATDFEASTLLDVDYLDVPAVGGGNAVDDGKAEPGAVDGRRVAVVEDPVVVLRWDTGTVVGDEKAVFGRADADGDVGTAVLDRVGEEVFQELPETFRVGLQRSVGRDLEGAGLRPDGLPGALCYGGQRGPFGFAYYLTAPRQGEQVVDDFCHPVVGGTGRFEVRDEGVDVRVGVGVGIRSGAVGVGSVFESTPNVVCPAGGDRQGVAQVVRDDAGELLEPFALLAEFLLAALAFGHVADHPDDTPVVVGVGREERVVDLTGDVVAVRGHQFHLPGVAPAAVTPEEGADPTPTLGGALGRQQFRGVHPQQLVAVVPTQVDHRTVYHEVPSLLVHGVEAVLGLLDDDLVVDPLVGRHPAVGQGRVDPVGKSRLNPVGKSRLDPVGQ